MLSDRHANLYREVRRNTRRRRRTETGRSPAQQTVRSRNDYRAAKRPGKRERRQLRQELHRQGSW